MGVADVAAGAAGVVGVVVVAAMGVFAVVVVGPLRQNKGNDMQHSDQRGQLVQEIYTTTNGETRTNTNIETTEKRER